MSAQTDPVYIAARTAVDHVSPLVYFDPNTSLGSNYWNLRNALDVARGDVLLGGTPISAETRAAVLAPDGELQPAMRSEMTTRTANLNAAFPTAATATGDGGQTTVGGQPSTVGFLSILDGEIFGVPKKLIAVGAIAFFLFKD